MSSEPEERVAPYTIAYDNNGDPMLNYQALGCSRDVVDLLTAVNDGGQALRASGRLFRSSRRTALASETFRTLSVTAEQICCRFLGAPMEHYDVQLLSRHS